MDDLISRNALLKDIEETVVFSVRPDKPSAEIRGANKILDRISSAPSVDAVEVVRCAECKEWDTKPIHNGLQQIAESAKGIRKLLCTKPISVPTEKGGKKMRLIDADALGVGKCSEDILPHAYCVGWNGLVEMINNAPTIDPESLRPKGKWISVEDRLPEENTAVIAAADKGIVFQCLYAHDGWDLWEGHKVNITHWMPLPEPPKGD